MCNVSLEKAAMSTQSTCTIVVITRDVEAVAKAGNGSCGSGPFSVEAEARKFYRFRFHIRI